MAQSSSWSSASENPGPPSQHQSSTLRVSDASWVTAVASAWTAVYSDCVAELALSPLKTTALGGREMTPPNCWQGRWRAGQQRQRCPSL
jgi:hypothetical protein